MDHVELKAYPFPNGVDVPRLMPFQEFPFNGDGYLAAEVLRLKRAHGVDSAMETGTCLGSTTLWLWENFNAVWSYEISEQYHNIASLRIGEKTNAFLYRCDSVGGLRRTLADFVAPFFLFLDAHWADHCPLLDELKTIASAEVKPVIIIHDFQVPGKDFGFDKMPDGRPFSLELVRPYMDRIYGADLWVHNYPTHVEGAKRGWASFEPLRL